MKLSNISKPNEEDSIRLRQLQCTNYIIQGNIFYHERYLGVISCQMSSQHRPGRCRALIFPSKPRSWERTRCCGGSGRQHAFSMMGKQRALPDWTHVQHSSNNNRRNTESYSQYASDCKFFLNSIPLYSFINTIHPIRNTCKIIWPTL